ncbi:hypothetical protein B0T10DRAFT_444714 [Thelonectria olida]|uniref:Zn(2)-C6 fungal-type domain-containing protein n=1 Tax=Thelonectria olida TaxID=1576542 RepID=A0A9P8VYW9_9HYPO|nr:hypothetical protein B0T10DRAFT_444714 [Thelonectria olida]
MARKGSRKVRTGCLTCKIRKVKCDEGKPHCDRCVRTGRKCDGYATPEELGLVSVRPRQGFQGIETVDEGRALQFFCEIAGPFLSGATDPYFWTRLVMQFSNFEPAVRQSVVAISTLYEQVQADPEPKVRLQDSRLALRHYNAAIRELKSMDNQPLVLLVCVLFICIEFLQSNREAAIEHCKHGIAILEKIGPDVPWVKEYLVPVFRRLSVFPFFFGNDTTNFPNLVALESPSPASFSSFSDAHSMMDGTFSRTLQLVRQGDPYRLGTSRHEAVPLQLCAKQKEIKALLEQWQVLFDSFEERSMLAATPVTEHFQLGEDYMKKMSRVFLSVRHEVCRIWSEMAFTSDETAYDVYIDNFRRLIKKCISLIITLPEGAKITATSPKFIFETGFTPMLFFIAMKCRCLETRLEALRLMAVLGVPRENLWEVSTMQALGRRVVEIEHDIVLNDLYPPTDLSSAHPLPPDEMRVRDTWTESQASIKTTLRGHDICGRLAGFFVRTDEGEINLHTEFMDEREGAPRERIRPNNPYSASMKPDTSWAQMEPSVVV